MTPAGDGKQRGLFAAPWYWTADEWARSRLWVLYWGYVNYLFLHDAWEAFGVTLAFEAVSMALRYAFMPRRYESEVRKGQLPDHALGEFVLADGLFRVLLSLATVIVAATIAWVVDLSTVEGRWGAGYVLYAVTFVVLRDPPMPYFDYAIPFVHAAFFGIFAEFLFMTEMYNYVVLAVYTVFVMLVLILTKYPLYVPLGVYAVGVSVFIGVWYATHDGRLPASHFFHPTKAQMP